MYPHTKHRAHESSQGVRHWQQWGRPFPVPWLPVFFRFPAPPLRCITVSVCTTFRTILRCITVSVCTTFRTITVHNCISLYNISNILRYVYEITHLIPATTGYNSGFKRRITADKSAAPLHLCISASVPHVHLCISTLPPLHLCISTTRTPLHLCHTCTSASLPHVHLCISTTRTPLHLCHTCISASLPHVHLCISTSLPHVQARNRVLLGTKVPHLCSSAPRTSS